MVKIRTRMCMSLDGYVSTPDGWPAHEPWRGAAIHAHESGAMGAVVMQAHDRLLRTDDAG